MPLPEHNQKAEGELFCLHRQSVTAAKMHFSFLPIKKKLSLIGFCELESLNDDGVANLSVQISCKKHIKKTSSGVREAAEGWEKFNDSSDTLAKTRRMDSERREDCENRKARQS